MDGVLVQPVCRIRRRRVGARESSTHRPGLTIGQRRRVSLAGNRLLGYRRRSTASVRCATRRQLQSAACRQRVGAGRTADRTQRGLAHRLVIPSAIAGRCTGPSRCDSLVMSKGVHDCSWTACPRRAELRGRPPESVPPSHDGPRAERPRPSGRPTAVWQRF